MKTKLFVSSLLVMALAGSCMKDDNMQPAPKDPDTAGDVSVDRLGSSFAHLFLRDAQNAFPEANLAIDAAIVNCPIVWIQQ